MKFVIAIDSFKGSISALAACNSIENGIKKVLPCAEVMQLPIADGGEGTLDALVLQNRRFEVKVCDPLFRKTTAQYGEVNDTAIIEMAYAAGLTLVEEDKRNAGITTTFGVGEMILDALNRGFRKIMLTAGGSATNDGGCGMLAALGAIFKDSDSNTFIPTGDSLAKIADIDLTAIPSALFECEITVATDVKNPLLGEHGATFVYAPQKGLIDGQQERLEAGMAHYARMMEQKTGRAVATIEGSGAGGGIAVPLLALFNADIRSGIDTVLDIVDFNTALNGATAVITGEGRLDIQSLYGKAISGVTKRAKARKIPVYCFVGCLGDDAEALLKMGIEDIYTVASVATSTEDSIRNANQYLTLMAENFAKKYI